MRLAVTSTTNTTRPSRADVLDEAIDWLALHQGGRPSRAQHAAFLFWLNADTRHREAYERAKGLWLQPEVTLAAKALGDNIGKVSQPRGWRRLSLGAVAMVMITLGLMTQLTNQGSISTAVGEHQHVALSDGSAITLNTDSKLVTRLNETRREVELLKGEAFFDVATDPDHPFSVVSGDIRIQVIGTEFSVHRQGNQLRVSVREGLVEVSREGQATERLNAGDRAIASKDTVRVTRGGALSGDFAWLENRLIFHDQPLSTVVDEVARYHRGLILLMANDDPGGRVSGNFSSDDPIHALVTLARLNEIDLVRLTDYLLILRRH